MADRITKVTLTASVNGYIADFERARQQTRKNASESEEFAASLEKQNQALSEVGVGLAAIGAIAAVGVALAVKKFADFDQAMSNVKAATQETAENMSLLREAALDAGASTVFTATEAANAIEELGKAGLSTKQILEGGLDGALSLAAAGQLSVADAAGIAAIAVKQFNLAGSDVPHVADLLAAGAGKAVGDVTDLSAALGQAGLVANGAGQSIEDTTGTLAAFADAGLLGSDAGTSLKAAIIALQAPTQKSRDVMEQYNLSFYDAQGNMLAFDQIAGQLKTNLSGLTDEQRNAALAQIFGNDALRVANVLYDEGASGIRKYINQTNESGYAAKVAADRLDNLSGDVEKLGGAFDTALIRAGSGANEVLRGLTQGATALVDVVGSLPAPVLNSGLAIGGLVAGIGLIGGGALVAVPKIAQFKLALETLSVSARSVGLAVAGITGAFAIAGLAISAFVAEQAAAAAKTKAYADTLEAGNNRITKSTREMAKEALGAKNSFLWMQQDSAYDAAEKLGISLDLVTDAATGNAQALEKLQKQIDEGAKQFVAGSAAALQYSNSAVDIENAVKGESGSIAQAIEIAKQKQQADKGSVESSNSAAEAYTNAADKVTDLKTQLSELIDTVNESNNVGQDAISANLDYQNSLADVDATIQKARDGAEGYALSLDTTTQAGRDNMDMLVGLAANAQDAAQKQLALDNNTEAYRATLESSRQALIDRAINLGYNADQAGALADQILRIPDSTEWQAIVETAAAQAEVNRFVTLNSGRQIPLRITAEGISSINLPNGMTASSYASGGEISGRGPKGVDSVHILAAPGEHMLTASEVDSMGGQDAVYAFRAALRSGLAPLRYAGGGEIQPRYIPQTFAGGGVSGGTVVTQKFNFNGQYAMTAEQLMGAAETEKRRAYQRTGATYRW